MCEVYIDWKILNATTLKSTLEGLHVWDVNRWILLCPMVHSVVRLCAYNVLDYSIYNDSLIVRFVSNEIIE